MRYWLKCVLLDSISSNKWSESHSVVSNSLQPHGLYIPWNSPGQNTGVGSLFLLQEIFPTQGSNPSLPHCKQILYQLSHQTHRKPYIFFFSHHYYEHQTVLNVYWCVYCFLNKVTWTHNQDFFCLFKRMKWPYQ